MVQFDTLIAVHVELQIYLVENSKMVASTLNIDAAILARVIAPHEPTLSPAAAQGLLALKFGDEDCAKMRELAEKARSGTLTSDEQVIIEGYERVGSLIGLLQSKARQSLKHSAVGRD